MPIAEYRRTPPRGKATPPAIEELSRVALATDLEVEGGRLPAGSTGTVVGIYRQGAAYEIEFTQPFHVVATVRADAILR